MIKKTILGAALVSGLLYSSSHPAFAGGTEPTLEGPYVKACKSFVRTFNQINFTDSQAATVAGFLSAFQLGMHDLGPQLVLARKSLLSTIFNSTDYNERVVRDAAANLDLIEQEAIVLYSKVVHNIKQIVTPVQYKLMLKGSIELHACSRAPLAAFNKYMNQWINEHKSS